MRYRFPFLDRELVSFALTIRPEHWPQPWPYARLQRNALAPLLPPEVASRFSKAEFTPALMTRFQRNRREISAILSKKTWLSASYLDPPEARKFFEGVLAEGESASSSDLVAAWSIVTLEAWLGKALGYHSAQSGGSVHVESDGR